MLQRKLFPVLVDHLQDRLITVLTGMRRVGKTTAIKFLLQQIPHNNKIFIDLEKIENRYIFNRTSYKEIQTELEILGIDFVQPAVIALDEIQLVPDIASVIKYWYDTYSIKFLLTGSSSFYIKGRFSESLAGRKRIFEMYPLNFAEFLHFKQQNKELLQDFAFHSFQQGIYLRYKEWYEEFIRFGGFPEVVLADSEDKKRAYLDDIINAYIELDIKLLSDFEASQDLYRLVRLLAGRVGSHLDYVKLSSILGIHRQKVKQYIELLERTYFILTLPPFTRNVDRELSHRRKVYLADNGLIQRLAQVSSGQIFENSIAAQLFPLGKLAYYQRKTGQEIDFILNENQAFEVKETPTPSDFATLEQRAKLLQITDYQLIGRYPPADGFTNFIWGGTVV